MDLPNNADIVLSPAHNLKESQFTTIYAAWAAGASYARERNFKRFADFGL